MSGARTRAALTLAGCLAGCAAVDPRRDFEDLQQQAAGRGSPELIWRTDAEADQEADRLVRDLLARELDVDAAVRLALLENRDLQAVYEELGIGRGLLAQASRPKNPVLDAEYRLVDGGGIAGIHISIVEEFLSILFLPQRQRLAEAEFAAKKLRVTQAVLTLAGEVRRTFFMLQAAEQQREMRESIVRATNASYDLATRIHAAGNSRDLDLHNERALYEQARLDLAQAEADAVRERERLNALMGLWGEQTGWTLGRRLPDPPQEQVTVAGLESTAVARSLDLEIARQEVETEARRLGLERATRFMPELNAGVTAERDPGSGTWSVGPSLAVPLPLFDQGQGRVAIATAVLRQREQHYRAVAVAVRAEVREVASAAIAAQRRARHYREVMLPLRRRIVADMQLEYNAMQVGASQLLQARRDEIEAGAAYIEAVRDYWLAATELEQLKNGGRAGGERPINRPGRELRGDGPSRGH